jgi:glycerophosphoryl diester phosphodiesterase
VTAPLVISHRTNAGTAPPNSLAGIAAALADGVDGIEMDVRGTGDGIPVLWHDPTITHDGVAIPLSDFTHGSLLAQRRDRAAFVPTLEEALALIARRTLVVLDIKERGLAEAVVGVVQPAQARCWVWAFDPLAGAEYEALLPDAQRALLVGSDWAVQSGGRAYLRVAREFRCAALSLEASLVSPRAVADAHEAGLAVYTWTVNEEAELLRVREAGVDAVCTDYPARARRQYERSGR